MIVNADKTKTMTFARSADKAQINITVNGNRLEQIGKLKYLSSTTTEDARSKTEINNRIGIANESIAIPKILWKDKTLTMKSKSDSSER